MRPLPLSLQDFSRLRELDCLYVDKTKFAYDLIQKQQSFFLARPRRFGKSLFVTTLRDILLGKKEFFTDCWIGKSSYAWHVYGVIHLDLAVINGQNAAHVERDLCEIILSIAKEYGILLETDFTDANILIRKLTIALYEKYGKVAILIDEYDHPILQSLQDSQVEEIRSVLQSFYSAVKTLNKYVYFLFITGVSMFSKAGIFSGMNHPINLSLDPDYAGICGYTEQELDLYFQEYMATWAAKENRSIVSIKEELKSWYNGYRFSANPLSVYNPFSVQHALCKMQCENFWFETGSPSFIVKELQKKKRKKEYELFDLSHFKVSRNLLGAVDVDQVPLSTLLFQTGYLTIESFDPKARNYSLKYPNQEVETALNQQFLTLVSEMTQETADYISRELAVLFDRGDIEEALACLQTLFSSIPYQLHIEKESFYHSLLQIVFAASGIQSSAEYSMGSGRIDLVLHLPSRIYICEIKLNRSAKTALAQIEKQRYYEPFLSYGKPIVLLGVSFTRKASDFHITYVKKELA